MWILLWNVSLRSFIVWHIVKFRCEFIAKFLRKAAEEATQAAIQKANEARHITARHDSTALLPFCSFCFAVSSSSAFDLPWDALILWITLIIFDKFFDSFGFYAVNEIAGHCGCGCQSGRPILESQTGSGCDGASRGWRSQKTHRLRCSASKNAMQSHALQMFVAFYGTGNVEIVALTLCTWSGSEHEVVHVWLFSRSSLGISQLHGLHWTWVLNHFEPR